MSTIVLAGASVGGSSDAPSGYAVVSAGLSHPSGGIDATQGFIDAYATGKPVYVPPGTYTVTNLPAATLTSLEGAGPDQTTIRYTGTGSMCTLTGQQRTKFSKLKFTVTNAAGTLFTVSNTFRASWTRCVFQGSHTAAGDSFATTTGHIGVNLTANSGDNLFYDCDFLNLGVGIKTDCIQNGVIGGKFGTCHVGVYGSGGGGMSLQGYIDFVAAASATPPTSIAIHIDGATGQWWLSDVWTEGCTTGIKVGTGTSGPSQFGMLNCKIAAVTTCIDMVACRNPTLWNVYCAGDSANSFTPDPLVITSANAPEGVAFIDSIITGKPVTSSTFPLGWVAHTRASGTSTMKAPNELQFSFGSKLRMARSDGTLTDTMEAVAGPLLRIRGPGSAGTIIRFLDTSSLPMLEMDTALTQVNYPAIVPGATTVGPAIVARGTDTNVDLALTPKGTGQVRAAAPVYLANTTAPATPTGGGVIYVESGSLKFKGSSGTVTVLGPA